MGRIRVHLLTAGLLAAGFAATTVFAVHLEFRRHAHSFLLSELPLVLGLYLPSPPELVLARLAGSAAVLATLTVDLPAPWWW